MFKSMTTKTEVMDTSKGLNSQKQIIKWSTELIFGGPNLEKWLASICQLRLFLTGPLAASLYHSLHELQGRLSISSLFRYIF